jgi:hypothetical protein
MVGGGRKDERAKKKLETKIFSSGPFCRFAIRQTLTLDVECPPDRK